MTNPAITPGQLEKLADMIAERLANQPRLVGKAELATKLGISVATIERLMADDELPYIKAKGRVVFDVEAVVAALKKDKPRRQSSLGRSTNDRKNSFIRNLEFTH